MFAIETKYVGPTNTKGARIIAKGNEKRVMVPYSHDHSGVEVHRVAVVNFLKTHGNYLSESERNSDNWIAGATDDGYAFVYAGSK